MIVLILRKVAVSGVWLSSTSASANLLYSDQFTCCQHQQEVEFVKVQESSVEQLEVLRLWRGKWWSNWSVLILKTGGLDVGDMRMRMAVWREAVLERIEVVHGNHEMRNRGVGHKYCNFPMAM